jgi:hypothetical protein
LGQSTVADGSDQGQILGPPLNTTTTESPSGDSLSHGQCDIMTRKTFHEPSLPPKSEPQSPDPSQTGNSTEGFDTMSARSVDAGYPLGCHERRTSSWAPASQYPELVSPYSTQQRMPYQSQPPYGPPRDNPSLPPIRDIDRMSTFDSPYSPTSNTYHPSFANPAGPQGGQDNYSYGSDRPSYYDPTHRYSQGYPPVNRQNPHLDFTRYAPSPYDYRAGVAYPSPYGTAEYASSPTGLHHPTSPTVAMDTNAQNRKRRGNLPRHITDILRTWFHDHLEHPYPTEDEKQILVARTNLTIAQVCEAGLLWHIPVFLINT